MDMHTRVDLGFTSHHSEAKNLITGVLQACTAFELYLFIREWRDVSHFAPFALRFTVAVVGFLIFPHSTIHPPPKKKISVLIHFCLRSLFCSRSSFFVLSVLSEVSEMKHGTVFRNCFDQFNQARQVNEGYLPITDGTDDR